MAKQLNRTDITDAVSIADAATSLPYPPTSFALVPDGWKDPGAAGQPIYSESFGVVPEFDLDVWSTDTVSFTDVNLFAGKLHHIEVDIDLTSVTNGTETFTLVAHGLETGDGPLRLETTATIVCDTNANGADGNTLTLGDGTTEVTFEYDKSSNGVGAGHVAWPAGTTAASNATALKGLIQAAFPDFVVTDNLAGTLTVRGHGNVPASKVGNVVSAVTAGALPTGTLPGVDYYAVKTDDDNFKLATSFANAFVPTIVSITTNGTGVRSVVSTDDTARMYWHECFPSPSDPIPLTPTRGFTTRCQHSPNVLAYALVGTLDTGSVSASIVPVTEREA